MAAEVITEIFKVR